MVCGVFLGVFQGFLVVWVVFFWVFLWWCGGFSGVSVVFLVCGAVVFLVSGGVELVNVGALPYLLL